MSRPERQDVPLEPASPPGQRSWEGSGSILPHLQQQVQMGTPPPPLTIDPDQPGESDRAEER